jgi:hypothetical protein
VLLQVPRKNQERRNREGSGIAQANEPELRTPRVKFHESILQGRA